MNEDELLDYFKGLSIREVLLLAKKSIMLTIENRELEYKITKYANINEQDTKDYAILYNKMENIDDYCQGIINTSNVNDNDKYIAENIMQIIRGED